MSPSVRLLLESHAADMRAGHCPRMRSFRAHALGALEGALVEMHHGDMPVKAVTEGEAALAGLAAMVALLEMRDAVMLVGVASFGEGFVAHFAGKGFDTMGCADMEREIFVGGSDVGAHVAGRGQ